MPESVQTALLVAGGLTLALVLVGFAFEVRAAIKVELAERRREKALERRLPLSDEQVREAYTEIAQANPGLRRYGRNLASLYLVPDRDGGHGWPMNGSGYRARREVGQ